MNTIAIPVTSSISTPHIGVHSGPMSIPRPPPPTHLIIPNPIMSGGVDKHRTIPKPVGVRGLPVTSISSPSSATRPPFAPPNSVASVTGLPGRTLNNIITANTSQSTSVNHAVAASSLQSLNHALARPFMSRAVSAPKPQTAAGPVIKGEVRSFRPYPVSRPSPPAAQHQQHAPAPFPADWRSFVAIEERQSVRTKLRAAYSRQCRTLEEMIEVAAAVGEELLYCSAPSRLDYFKSSIDWENRLQIKKKLLERHRREESASDHPQPISPQVSSNSDASCSDEDSSSQKSVNRAEPTAKRAKH
eukprot:112154_1